MNRIEETMERLKENGKKAVVTYITAGCPDLKETKERIRKMKEEADMIELGIPFSDPVADGPVFQDAFYNSILHGTTLKKVFHMMEEIRKEGMEIPVIFRIYYNTILHYGMEAFAGMCQTAGVDGLLVPDLPFEEQEELQAALLKDGRTILIQIVSRASRSRIAKILKDARGFVCCLSTGDEIQKDASLCEEDFSCLKEIREASAVPVLMEFETDIRKEDASAMEMFDGAVFRCGE